VIPWEEIDRAEVPGHEGGVTLLKQVGFQTETVTVSARKSGKGGRHTIWLAGKP